MNNTDKMSADERKIAARVVNNCAKAADALKRIHGDCEKLLEVYGWDVNAWDASQAGLMVGNIGLAIAQSIGCEDGWCDESEVV